MADGEIVELPLAQIYPGPLVREDRLDLDHVAVLAAVETLPPIIVRQTRKGYECLDGAHRCAARKTNGCDVIRAVVREADDAEALEIAYSSNNGHGLPLTLGERKAGARKLIAETQLSDATIATIVGLGRDTIAGLRPSVQGVGNQQPEHRAGKDGKEYPTPAVAALVRRRAEQAIADDPTLSVRALAKQAGCSTGTAQDVIAKSKIEPQGELPPPPAAPGAGTVARPSADGDQRDGAEDGLTRPSLGVVPPLAETEPTVAETIPHFPPAGQWVKADGMAATNATRDFAQFMDRRGIRSGETPADIAAMCPAAHRASAATAARVWAAAWSDLADALEAPARLEEAR